MMKKIALLICFFLACSHVRAHAETPDEWVTLGQNSLRVLPTKSGPTTLGIIVSKHKKTGQSVRYTLPDSARSFLDAWNKDKKDFPMPELPYLIPQNQSFPPQVRESR